MFYCRSEHDANTERMVTKTSSMRHVEGGWPKDVDFTEQSDVSRFRKKVEKDEDYKGAVKALGPIVARCLKQNITINIYEVRYHSSHCFLLLFFLLRFLLFVIFIFSDSIRGLHKILIVHFIFFILFSLALLFHLSLYFSPFFFLLHFQLFLRNISKVVTWTILPNPLRPKVWQCSAILTK